MAIPDSIIDQVQARNDIVEVVSSYIPLKKTGKSYKANCPFHHEKTPSFVVSQEKQIYHCFGCGVGGNVFSFVMRQENIEFPEAVELLAEKAGIKVPRSSGRSGEENALADRLFKINDLACSFFHDSLMRNKEALDYLASRGVGTDAVKRFRLGYAPDSWDSLGNYFKSKGFEAQIIEKAGLVIANDRGGHYDRFRKRVIFPISDLKSRTLGFGGRVMDSSLPKYINSPETVIYSKGKNLYGLSVSRDDIKKAGHALIVEGYLDFLIPYQAGVKNLIATLGTALTIDQVKLLKRFAGTVVMVYDPDAAGEAASIRNLELFITEDVNVYIAELPPGLDPDSYIRKHGAESFNGVIKSSKNLFDYKLDKLVPKYDIASIYGKTRIAAEMLPTIEKIGNAVLKSTLIKRLADKLKIDEDALKVELKKIKPEGQRRQYQQEEVPVAGASISSRKEHVAAEKMIIALLMEGGSFITKVAEDLRLEDFKDSTVQEVVAAVFELAKKNETVSAARLINHVGTSSDGARLVSEAVSLLETVGDKQRALSDCIARIKKDALKERLRMLKDEIDSAHVSGKEDRVRSLVEEYDSLVKISRS